MADPSDLGHGKKSDNNQFFKKMCFVSVRLIFVRKWGHSQDLNGKMNPNIS